MYCLKDKTILLTGAKGFLGSHVHEALASRECLKVLSFGHNDCDLTLESEVRDMLSYCRPHVVVQMAGLVGGIGANSRRPADFLYVNLMIDALTMHYAREFGAERFVAAAAGCGYPESAPVPLKEADFWNGYPQSWSAPYSLAKRMLDIHSRALWQQHKFLSLIVIPGNIFGPRDNFNLQDAHVIPALVRKFVDAVEDGAEEVVVWGTGAATRDFVYAADVAECILRAVEIYDTPQLVNVSSGEESSIWEVVDLLAELTKFRGRIVWDRDRPDGQLRRCFDVSKASADLGFFPAHDLRSGLAKTVEWYRVNRNAPGTRK